MKYPSYFIVFKIILLITLVYPNYFFSQVKLIDFATKKPIKNSEVLINDNIRLKSNHKGIVKFDSENIQKITILNGDYHDFSIIDNQIIDNVVLLKPIKTKNIKEVVLKDEVFNDYSSKRKILSVPMPNTIKNQTVLVEQQLEDTYKIKKTLFFLEDVKRGSELNFVIYKKNGDIFTQVFSKRYTQLVNDENEMVFKEDDIILEKGTYFFGIEWISNEKTNIKMDKILKVNVSGFSVSGFFDEKMKERFYFFDAKKNTIKEESKGKLAIKLIASKL